MQIKQEKSELLKACCFIPLPAVNDACLVFDGRLVIDANFHTNDVAIRAAGSFTKYQRIYHADQWTHANYNSREVGIHVSVWVKCHKLSSLSFSLHGLNLRL